MPGESEEPINIPDAELVNDAVKDLEKKLQKEPTKPSEAIDNVLIIDNLPIVGPDKLGKLTNVLSRIYKVCEVDINEIIMPTDPKTEKSFGYALIPTALAFLLLGSPIAHSTWFSF